MSYEITQELYDSLKGYENRRLLQDYGLRQVKYFIDIDYPKAIACLPEGARVAGINTFGCVTALDESNEIRYGFDSWIPEWVAAIQYPCDIQVKTETFQAVYDHFKLQNYELDDLTHSARNFFEKLENK